MSGSQMLPFVKFDKKALFAKSIVIARHLCVILRHFRVQLHKQCPFKKNSGCCPEILNYTLVFHQFLKIPNCTIRYKVTKKRVNHGARYGLDTPVQCRLIGAKKAVEWEEKNIMFLTYIKKFTNV